jgi:hypothetical protein
MCGNTFIKKKMYLSGVNVDVFGLEERGWLVSFGSSTM